MKKLKEIFNQVSILDRVQGAIFGATAGFVIGGGHPVSTILMGIAGFVTGGKFLSEVFSQAMAGAGAGAALKVFRRSPSGPQLPV